MFDIQTLGLKLEKAKKIIAVLENENKSLKKEINKLKQTVEDILLSPGQFEYNSGSHPMLTDTVGQAKMVLEDLENQLEQIDKDIASGRQK